MKTNNYSLNESLGHLASAASRAVLKRINAELLRNGFPITSEQFSALVHVWDQNGQPQYQLVEALNKDKTTLARVLAHLESLELVVRIPGQVDAREKNVFLTEKGRAVMAQISEVVNEILLNGQKNIEENDLAICKKVLRQFHKNLL
jgi:DNA-binding MarR family transcriptional regulator